MSNPRISSTLDADTLAMLEGSLRHVLAEDSATQLADRLAELGWDGVVADDPSAALRTLFEVKGDTLANADALGPELSRLLDGGAAISFPSPFGDSTLGGDHLDVDAVVLTNPAGGPIAVPVNGRLAVVPSDGLTLTPLHGIDDDLGLLRVTGTAKVDGWHDEHVWEAVVARGRWLLSCELVGVARHVVAEVVEYTKERVQYGKPIGVFQALQHRLASAHSMVVGAGHLATEAGDDDDPWTAIVAKSMAGQAAEFACVQAQQCYGAIGFTWEHEFHRYLRRTYALDRMLGDWRSLEHEIGDRLQADRAVPRIGAL